jgi:hypothetical protein
MKTYPITAALLSLGLAASGILPAVAQTNPRVRLLNRPAAADPSHRGPMTITTMMPNAQIHGLPEHGTLQQPLTQPQNIQQQLIGPAIVTGVRGSVLTFRLHSGVIAAIQMPPPRMRVMRLTAGTLLRFKMLNSRQFQMFVTGGRLAPCMLRCAPQRPTQ